jgi:DNA-binding NarL/FixJ family response regulator
VRVLIQSRQCFVREALTAFLSEQAHVEVVGVAAHLDALLHFEGVTVDAAVVSPEAATGSAHIVAALRAQHQGMRVIAVERDRGIEAILAALGVVATPASPGAGLPDARVPDGPRLTRRECEVLNEIQAGASTQQIAARLAISPDTVEKHKRSAFEKLGVRSQAHAVAVALRHGLLPALVPSHREGGGRAMHGMSVAVAHPTSLVRELVAVTLESAGYQVKARVGTREQLVAACRAMPAAVTVADVRLPDGLVHQCLREVLRSGTRVLVLATGPADPALDATLLAGASGHLFLDDAAPTELVEGVRRVAQGAAVLHPDVAAAILDQWRAMRADHKETRADLTLTPREYQVLHAMAQGLGTKAIARLIGTAPKTVEHHKARVFDKLQARNQAQAISLALAAGLLNLEASGGENTSGGPEGPPAQPSPP